MVDEKITDYTAQTGAGLATADLFEIVDVSDTTMDATGTNKKMTADELAQGIVRYSGTNIGRAVTLPGSNQNYPTTPTGTGNRVSGTQVLDVRVRLLPNSWVVSGDQHIISQWDDTSNKGWKLKLVGGIGNLEVAWTADGTGAGGTPAPSRSLTGYVSDGRPSWVRAYVNPASGGGNYTARLYVSDDYDPDTQQGTWTQLGVDATVASAVQSIFASTAPTALGVRNPGAGGGAFMTGSVMYAQIFRDTTLVASFDATAFRSVSAGATYLDPQGNTWTMTGSGWSITPFQRAARWSAVDVGYADSIVLPWALGSSGLGTVTSAASVNSANSARGVRVRIPRTGNLRDLAIFPNAQSGNIDVGVLDTGEASSTVRTKLWSTGSIACPAAGAWAVVGDPNLPVRAGQWVEFYLSADNATATFLRLATLTGAVASLPTNYITTPGGAGSKYAWFTGGSNFPLPSSIAEASLTANGNGIVIIGRIS